MPENAETFPQTYSLAEDGRSITCRRCLRTSHNPSDIANVYCGHCHVFHDDIFPAARAEWLKEPVRSLVSRFPAINWREPVVVRLVDSKEEHYACRLCIGLRGLAGHEIEALPTSREECERHIKEMHPE